MNINGPSDFRQGGVKMKKYLIIILLSALQGACAYHGPGAADDRTLLSYQELGSQITVTRIVVDEHPDAADAP